MFHREHSQDAFFDMKALAPRPMSDATEMFDTDFEDEDSEIEDNSPRLSLASVSLLDGSPTVFTADCIAPLGWPTKRSNFIIL
jgi:hypothetical protein